MPEVFGCPGVQIDYCLTRGTASVKCRMRNPSVTKWGCNGCMGAVPEAKVDVEDGAVDIFANLPEEGDRNDSRRHNFWDVMCHLRELFGCASDRGWQLSCGKG